MPVTKSSTTDQARKRAKEIVAQVKQRVARQEGTPAPEDAAAGSESAHTAVRDNEAEAMAAKSAQAKGVRKQHAIAKSHSTRAQGHAAARTQRTQGRRDSK